MILSVDTLKFLFVIPNYYPQLDIACVSDLINSTAIELTKKGHDVHIMNCLDASSKKLKNCSSEFKAVCLNFEKAHIGLQIHTITSPFKTVDSYFAYLFGSSAYSNHKLHQLVKEIKPDVVHFHAPMFFGHKILYKKGNYLSVYTAHDYWFICQRAYLLKKAKEPCKKQKNCLYCALRSGRPPQFGYYSFTFKRAVKSVDLILTPSLKVKEILSTQLDNKIECVPHFVPDTKQFISPSGYSNFFLYAGTFDVHKGIFDLLEVFNKYSEIKEKLIIVGRGPLQVAIDNFIREHSLQDKVILLGFVDKSLLWSLYKDASALIVPSLNHDPCPTVIMEAFSVGTPVIGSDTGGIPEMVKRIDEALVFPAGNLENLAKILVAYDKRKYSANKIISICQNYFSVEEYVKEYLAVLKSAFDSKLFRQQG